MKKLLLLIILTASAIGQMSLGAEDENADGERYRVLKRDGSTCQLYNGKLTALRVEGFTREGLDLFVAREDIMTLHRCTGDKGREGAKAGALTGLALAGVLYMMAVSQASGDPYLKVNHARGLGMVLVTTAVSAGIGSLIGMRTKTWEKVPLETGFQIDSRTVGAKLTFTFSF